MKVRRLLTSIGVLTWMSATGVLAQDVTLRFKHTAGTVLNYNLQITTPTAQSTQMATVILTRSVTAVDGLGNMDITTSFANGQLTVNGIPQPYPIAGDVLRTVLSPRGELVSTLALGGLAGQMNQVGVPLDASTDVFRGLGVLEFPVDPVTTGSTWTVDKSQDLPNGDSFQVQYNYTLEGFEDYGGYNCARIVIDSQPVIRTYQDYPESRRGFFTNGQSRVSGTLLFAHSEGRVVKLDQTVETSAVSMMVSFEGEAQIVPSYQKTTVAMELQP